MAHEVVYRNLPNGHRAECLTCGWKGPDRMGRNRMSGQKVKEDAITHKYKTKDLDEPSGGWAGLHSRG